jgi:hypothetical protein
VLDGELIFVPGDIPRRGVFANWGNGSGSARLELVFPGGTYGVRKRLVSAEIIPLAEALPALLAIDPGHAALRRSARVWAAAAAARMGVTQGRVSAIEHAKPGTTELRTLAAYVEALGGRPEIIADFGDERLAFTEPGTEAA